MIKLAAAVYDTVTILATGEIATVHSVLWHPPADGEGLAQLAYFLKGDTVENRAYSEDEFVLLSKRP